MIQTVTVGTDGSDTADKAVQFAFDLAEKFGAKIVIASSYRPVSEDKVRRDQREAPEDIQWSLNPTQEVDANLKAAAERAGERGHRGRHRGPRGPAGRRPVRHRRGLRLRRDRGRQPGHAPQGAGQRPEQRLPQRAVLGGDSQDDVSPGSSTTPATSADVQRVESSYEALNRGDIDGTVAVLHDDAKWVEHSDLPEAGTYEGVATIRSFLEHFLESWEDFHQEIEDKIVRGPCVLLFIHLARAGRAAASRSTRATRTCGSSARAGEPASTPTTTATRR